MRLKRQGSMTMAGVGSYTAVINVVIEWNAPLSVCRRRVVRVLRDADHPHQAVLEAVGIRSVASELRDRLELLNSRALSVPWNFPRCRRVERVYSAAVRQTAAMQELPSAGFANVDRTADPRSLVSYLDQVTGLEAAQAYKRQTFILMGVQPGHAVLDVGCGAGDDLRQLATWSAPRAEW